jgi:hypothetical protein
MCGAVYDVTITRLAARADYDAICDVCEKVMNEWHGTVGRAYTLKSQSANAKPPLIRINSSVVIDPYYIFGCRQSWRAEWVSGAKELFYDFS